MVARRVSAWVLWALAFASAESASERKGRSELGELKTVTGGEDESGLPSPRKLVFQWGYTNITSLVANFGAISGRLIEISCKTFPPAGVGIE